MDYLDHPYLDRNVRILNSGSDTVYRVVEVQVFETMALARLRTPNGTCLPRPVNIDRLELVPYAEERTPAARAGYQRPSGFAVHADEATEWFAFVMLQAGSLFESVPNNEGPKDEDGCYLPGPDGGDRTRAELLRLLTVRGENMPGPVVTAALAYYDAAKAWYDADKEQNP